MAFGIRINLYKKLYFPNIKKKNTNIFSGNPNKKINSFANFNNIKKKVALITNLNKSQIFKFKPIISNYRIY